MFSRIMESYWANWETNRLSIYKSHKKPREKFIKASKHCRNGMQWKTCSRKAHYYLFQFLFTQHYSSLPFLDKNRIVGYRYAMAIGSNKGIGLETVRQLASQGVTVVLTARNEKRGMEALLKLQELGLSSIVFHQLDVLDPVSIKSLANFIQEKIGRLDILVRMKFFPSFFLIFYIFNCYIELERVFKPLFSS